MTVGVHELFENMCNASCVLVVYANWVFRCFWEIWNPAFASFVDLIDEALVVTVVLAVVIKVLQCAVSCTFSVWLSKFYVPVLL